MDIVSHKGWGANYLRPLQRTNVRNKTAFLVHYHGGIPRNSVGKAVPKEVEAIHHANGWNGLGYNFAVDQAGTIYEGYGWDGVGAQCPGFNTSGIGTYVAIGGDQKPTDAALASVRWLYDEGCRRSGNSLRKMGHRDGWATACPGSHLYAWVQAGMPAPDTNQEDIMATLKELEALLDKKLAEVPGATWRHRLDNPREKDAPTTAEKWLVWSNLKADGARAAAAAIADPVAFAAALAPLLASAGGNVTDEQLERVLRKVLASLGEDEAAPSPEVGA